MVAEDIVEKPGVWDGDDLSLREIMNFYRRLYRRVHTLCQWLLAVTGHAQRWIAITLGLLGMSLWAAPMAFASAGGGASGFSDGGGGGHGGGGSFFLFYIVLRLAALTHGLILIPLAIGYVFYRTDWPKRSAAYYRGWRERGPEHRRQRSQRQRRVELAAAEASDDNPIFDPDAVRSEAASLFVAIQQAWSHDDTAALQRMVGRDLMREWDLRLDNYRAKGWTNRVEVIGNPDVDLIGLHNDDEQQVVVDIRARVRDIVINRQGRTIKREDAFRETARLHEIWTLSRHGSRWIVVSVEQGAEGQHALADDIVANAAKNDQRLQQESMLEVAAADTIADSELDQYVNVEFAPSAETAANDLSVLDTRFTPDVLQVVTQRAVSAWLHAVDGDDDRFLAIADAAVVRELLYPSDTIREVVRGVKVEQLQIDELDLKHQPVTMTISLKLRGIRYQENRSTAALIGGSKTKQQRFAQSWTLALSDNKDEPWRIVAARQR
jgi:predicted lipid-binding transport protein (Tim44 family)